MFDTTLDLRGGQISNILNLIENLLKMTTMQKKEGEFFTTHICLHWNDTKTTAK